MSESETREGQQPGMAMGGRRVEVKSAPPMPTWPTHEMWSPSQDVEETVDALDVADLNRMLLASRRSLFTASARLREAQRESEDASLRYRRAYRRFLVTITGGSAETRKVAAEIACEEFENDMVVKAQVAEEWKRHAQDCRDNVKAIENVAHNVRAQMSVI